MLGPTLRWRFLHHLIPPTGPHATLVIGPSPMWLSASDSQA